MTTQRSESLLISLIGDLYNVADDLEQLPILQQRMCEVFDGCDSNFCISDRALGLREYIGFNLPESVYQKYSENIEDDPWFYEAARKVRQPGALVGSGLLSNRELQKTRMYADYYADIGYEYLLANGNNPLDEFAVFLTVNRARGQKDFDEGDITRIDALTPHLQRVGRLLLERMRPWDAEHVLCVDVDRSGVSISNEATVRMIEKTSLLALAHNRLEISDFELNRIFQNRLELLLQGDRNAPSGIGHPIRLISETESLTIFLSPVAEATLDHFVRRRVRIYMCSEAINWGGQLQEDYGLTAAELKLIRALMGGIGTNDYALREHRSINTVRTQLKSAMGKLGVSSQLQLAKQVLLHS